MLSDKALAAARRVRICTGCEMAGRMCDDCLDDERCVDRIAVALDAFAAAAVADEHDELRKQMADEGFHHAACLSIAEGKPGPEYAAAEAVQRLRAERDRLKSQLAIAMGVLRGIAVATGHEFYTRNMMVREAGSVVAAIDGDTPACGGNHGE